MYSPSSKPSTPAGGLENPMLSMPFGRQVRMEPQKIEPSTADIYGAVLGEKLQTSGGTREYKPSTQNESQSQNPAIVPAQVAEQSMQGGSHQQSVQGGNKPEKYYYPQQPTFYFIQPPAPPPQPLQIPPPMTQTLPQYSVQTQIRAPTDSGISISGGNFTPTFVGEQGPFSSAPKFVAPSPYFVQRAKNADILPLQPIAGINYTDKIYNPPSAAKSTLAPTIDNIINSPASFILRPDIQDYLNPDRTITDENLIRYVSDLLAYNSVYPPTVNEKTMAVPKIAIYKLCNLISKLPEAENTPKFNQWVNRINGAGLAFPHLDPNVNAWHTSFRS